METEQEQQLQELDMQMDNLDVDMQQFEQELQKEIEGFEGMDNTENMEN
jgi:hypothetical protein